MKWGVNGLGLLMVLTLISAARAEPSGLLNDTGLTHCLNVSGNALEPCWENNSGDKSPYPGQDGRFGRDPASIFWPFSGFYKPADSGGHGGFAFTPLDVNGNPIPLVGDPPVPSQTPRCVWDRVTNLIWEVRTNDSGLQDKGWTYSWGNNPGGNCFGGVNCNTSNYVSALNAASPSVCPISGASSWRLPNRRELLSLVNHQRFNPSIESEFFPFTVDLSNGFYWSSDEYALNILQAWHVLFSTGDSFAADKTALAHTRLVRNGPGAASTEAGYLDNGDGTVKDKRTGLIWDQCSWGQEFNMGSGPGSRDCNGYGTPKSWVDALSTAREANSINHRGHNDWRVPNHTELESLVNHGVANPVIDTNFFPGTPSHYFWSSSVYAPYVGGLPYSWFVHFLDGNAVSSHQGNLYHVRLVRGGAEYNAYDLVQKKHVSPIIIADNKVYDGTSKATISACILDMADPNDDVACKVGVATFNNPNPRDSKYNQAQNFVTATGITIEGKDAYRYALTSTSASANAEISQRMSEAIITVLDKVYDGTVTAEISTCEMSNIVAGDLVYCDTYKLKPNTSFSDKNVGENKLVTGRNAEPIYAYDAWKYYFPPHDATALADITPRPTFAHYIPIKDKLYDGTKTATITDCALANYINNGEIACTASIAQFADPNAGVNKEVSVSGLSIIGTEAGNYYLTSTTATTWGNILKAPATVTLANLTASYTGSPLSPSASTSPGSLALTWTGAPQTNAGSYPVTAAINEQNYEGNASGTFVIQRAPATVSLGNLTQTYTGLPLSPTATTNPPGLSVSLTGAPQTNAGSYPVSASITDGNYTGSVSGTLTIAKAPQAPVFINAPAWVRYQQAGLTVFGFGGSGGGTFTYSAAGSTACTVHPTSGALTITSGSGSCQVTATRLADNNYQEASSAPAIIQVNKALQAPLTVSADPPSFFSGGPGTTLGYAGGTINGSVVYQVSGSPASLTCKISGSTVTAIGGAGTCSVTATMAGNANYEPVTSAVLDVPVVGGVLTGLAAQGQVGTNNQVQFGAFTISGESRKVLIRGLGPALDGFVSNAIRDPKIALSLNGALMPLEVNDDWADADNAAEIMALKHQPKNPTESAILRTLEPGIYNVHLSGSGGTEGIGMFQVYAVEGGGNGELKGLAAQGQIGTGNQVQFGAFTISGGPRKVLIRGLGPALDGYVPNAIRNPKIALSLNGAPTPLEVNDDWADADNAAEIMALKHQPKNPTESAILRTLEPGIYNVHLSGSGGTEGIGMFQVYTVE